MRWLRAVAALAVLGLLVAGVPVMLLLLVGNPWPDGGVALDQPLTDEAIIGVLTGLAWLLWAQLLTCIVVEAVAAIRNSDVDIRVPGAFGFQQYLARVLITSVALAIGSVAVTSVGVGTAAAAPSPPAAAPAPGPVGGPVTMPRTERVPGAVAVVTVQHGDTLWRLAEQHLGDGAKYTEIAALNEGQPMPDGRVFRSAESLLPGWELKIPATAAGTEGRNEPANDRVTVEAGDTLWSLAEDQYGDGAAWPRLWEANRGEQFDDGAAFTDPDLIQPGWDLAVPAVARKVSPPAPGAKAPGVSPRPDRVPAPPTQVPPERTAELAPAGLVRGAGAGAAVGADGGPSSRPRAHDRDPAERTDAGLPSWVTTGLLGAGSLLAGSLLLALRVRRAGQHRFRRPGRSIPATSPELRGMEKSITLAGSATSETVTLVDTLLVRLAASLAARSEQLPSLAAVEVTSSAVALHLRAPSTGPGGPWVVSEDGLVWVVDADVDVNLVGPHLPDAPAPWPLLVTVGHDASGASWMLNVEDLNVLVTGDESAVADFARFVAAEVACNPWSKHAGLEVVGVAEEVAAMSPDRVTVHADASTAAAAAVAEAVGNIDRLATKNIDTTTARAQQADPDPWPARTLIISQPGDVAELEQLVQLIGDHPGRTATAVVLAGTSGGSGFEIHIDERRRLTAPAANLTVQAVGLTTAEAHGCAALLAQADTFTDEAAPGLAGAEAWKPMANAMGALRDEYTVSRSGPTSEPADSMLPAPDEAYTSVAATTPADLNAVAPRVTHAVRDEVADADPNLDGDLRAWEDANCVRPRLTLLGPVGARTSGAALDRRKPFYTELFAYLATRPYGATTEEVATAFDLSSGRVRTDVNKLRDWLGADPATGQKFLPAARDAPSAQQRGIGVYEVTGALLDIDLFRRLRLRGETRGPAGVEYLERALQLVTGRPFDRLRREGWGWLLEGDRLDQHMVCAIADVAHVVVSHNLHAGNLDRARAAADIAKMAAPDEEIVRLDYAAVLAAQGHDREARRIIREDVCNRDDAGEAATELPARTEQIIDTRHWSRRAAM